MLGLLALATLAHAMQPQAIATGFRSIFTAGDRNSMFIDSDLDRRAELINIFLAICIFSMGAYISLLAYVGTEEYSFRTYGMIILITIVLLLARALFGMLAAFTFVPRSTTHAFFYHYYHLTVCTALIHYPIVLLCLFWIFFQLIPVDGLSSAISEEASICVIAWIALGIMVYVLNQKTVSNK